MITLEHISSKRRITKTNRDAQTILNGPLGHKYKVVSQDKVETPPEVKEKVSLNKKPKNKNE